jgi:hypothetical protein
LSAGQLAELAGLVTDGIAILGDANVRAPAVADYVVGAFARRTGSAWLQVKIDFSDFDVCLYAFKDPLLEIAIADRLVVLADNIVKRVAEIAANRKRRSAAIQKAREITEKALRRHDAGITVEGFGPAGESIMTSMRNWPLRLEATFRLLGDDLSSRLQCCDGRTGRDFASWVNVSAPNQRKRLKQLARLEKCGAIIEIDVLAERAIRDAGRTVGEVASELLAQPLSENVNRHPDVSLSGQRSVDQLRVAVRDGCIVAFVTLPGIGILHSGELVLDSCVPPSIANILVGKSPSLVLDHPLLRAGVKIRRIDTSHPSQTFIYLKVKRRGVSDAEIKETSIAA